MSRIFVSHASADDAAVTELSGWLTSEISANYFVDHLHIAGGADWNVTLPQEMESADTLLIYVTRDWLSSVECYAEYRAFYYANRPVVPLLVAERLNDLPRTEAERFHTLCASVQGIPFGSLPPNALAENLLRGALELARRKLRKRRRDRVFRIGAIFATLMVLTLSGLAVHFRDALGAYADRLRIARSFNALSAEIRNTLVQPEATALPDRVFRECGDLAETPAICPEMIVLPPGRFRMGSTDDFLADPSELPQAEMEIPTGLAVSVAEITRAQRNTRFLSTRLDHASGCKQITIFEGQENHPVESISWRDSMAYVAWINRQLFDVEDGPYRLLSEAEWEYAARGVLRTTDAHTLYSWGDLLEPAACRYANMLNSEMPDTLAIDRPGLDCPNNPELSTAVTTFAPNAFGLQDTAGNVAEWVEDFWQDSHYGRPPGPVAWVQSDRAACDRVIKGGSWLGEVDNLRPAARVRAKEDLFGFNIGFRIARDLNWRAEAD